MSTVRDSYISGCAGADPFEHTFNDFNGGISTQTVSRGTVTFRVRKIAPDAVCCSEEATATGHWSNAQFK